MAETTFRGPGFVAGSIYDGRVETMDGPSVTYQGDGIPDIRIWPTKKDGLYPGRVPAFLNSPYIVMVDNVPQAVSTTAIVNAQAAVAGVPLVLSATALAQANGSTAGNPTMSPGVPLVPFGKSTSVNVLALDFGFTTGTTTVGGASTTITVPDSTLFALGQWIYVGGAGNAGKTIPLLTQVLTAPTATTITVSSGALAAITNAPIGNTNMSGPLPGGGTPAYLPTGASPFYMAGLGTFLNPPEGITRCLSITANAGATVATILVTGYDIYGQLMTQNVTVVAAGVAYTTKAFKYFVSAVPITTDAGHTYSVGITDTFGFALRSDKWEYTQTFWNGAYLIASTGWLKGVQTTPATSLTGDVRGIFEIAAPGPVGAFGSAQASNGTTARLMMAVTVPLWNDIFGTPLFPAAMFGPTQA